MSQLLYSQANTTRSEIALLETPPALGRFHYPYSFDSYLTDVEEALDKNGLVVANQEYELTHDNNRMFGVMEVQPKSGEIITADEWKLLIGVRGSHDQKFPRGLSLGSQVMVCSNLCFNGNIGDISTRQTLNIERRLPNLINDAIQRVPELAYNQQRSFDRYKDVELTPRQGDAFLVEGYRRGAFSSQQLARAIQEWDSPTYEEHGEHGDSVWKLFNASTEALKPLSERSNTETVRVRSEKVSRLMDEVAGI